jgi:hypothetical protein
LTGDWKAGVRQLGLTACAFWILAFLAPTLALGADNHTLDTELSLTGDCSVSLADPDPDPGPCPGVLGIDHPPTKFDNPCGVTVDTHGYIYVASSGDTSNEEGRIDIFDPQGEFVLEIEDTAQSKSPCGLAVDSGCNLYVDETNGPSVFYSPDACPPAPTTDFGSPTPIGPVGTGPTSVAVDRSNDHLYLLVGTEPNLIEEYDSVANGSALLKTITLQPQGIACAGDLDVLSSNHDIYLSGCPYDSGPEPLVPRVFVLDGSTGERKQTLTGVATPTKAFSFVFGQAGIAVDQESGDLRVTDFPVNRNVVIFDAPNAVGPGEEAPEEYLGCIGNHQSCEPVFKSFSMSSLYSDIAIDDSGGENHGYIYITSGSKASNAHLWAFAPVPPPTPPAVCCEAVSQITDSGALLEGKVNANALPTTYRFEYTTEADFLENGYANAIEVPAGEGNAGSGGAFTSVSEPLSGLAPGTAYRFRLVATNHCEPLEPETRCETFGEGGSFATYPVPLHGLPDGRAYELVTPPDTNGRIPTAALFGWQSPDGFPTLLSSPDGASLIFGTEGGSLPQAPGSGLYDTYQAVRGSGGWESRLTGPSGSQATSPRPGGVSPDHQYSTLYTEFADEGSLGPPESNYLRHPDGSFEPIGVGSLGTDPRATSRLITAGGIHVIFVTGEAEKPSVRLEPTAPPSGTDAIYDRSPGGPTRVVSLLPGDVPLQAGEDAQYLGASSDGEDVVFEVEGAMYARRQNSITVPVVDEKAVFAGVFGGVVFYLKDAVTSEGLHEGEIFACDLGTAGCVGPGASSPIQIGDGGKSTVVNISADGSRVYFSSPEQLDGVNGKAGADNLYVWEEGTVRFVVTLGPDDLVGEELVGFTAGGLGLWTTDAVAPAYSKYIGPANDPSRTTPDGSVIVFESRANLTPPYDSEGHREVYRYDAVADELLCVSCNPTGLPAASDATLQTPPGALLAPFPPLNAITPVANVTEDGETVFFQSTEALVPRDVDERIDVYEWKAEGTDGCVVTGGCLHLISSGQSAGDDYLYAATSNGSSVFFQSGDMLVPRDTDAIPSIYVARVGGGFPEPPPPLPCQSDACQGAPSAPPTISGPASTDFQGPTGVQRRKVRRCPKGKRKVRRAGKTRCVKAKKRQSHKRRVQR